MIYRPLGRTGLQASEVGLGGEHLEKKGYAAVKAVIDEAREHGVNIIDLFMSEPQIREDIGKAIADNRGGFIIQGHIGSLWKDGQYARSRDLAENKFFFDDLLARMKTDYIDIGMIHFIDSDEEYEAVFNSDIMEYALDLKKKGVIRAVGLSSHNPSVSKRAVETDLIDVLMFSINPAYDLLPPETALDDLFEPDVLRKQTALNGVDPARTALYNACVKHGCGITVMKTLCGGMLLSNERSAFGKALTPAQCMSYALSRPAVASVLIGCQTVEEMRQILTYENATDAEKDFSDIFTITPAYSENGRCVYCNHCLPCAAKIDIAQVNKYLDLTSGGDIPQTVAEHYAALAKRAGDCTECGLCEPNCPFGVPIRERMKRAKAVFGG